MLPNCGRIIFGRVKLFNGPDDRRRRLLVKKLSTYALFDRFRGPALAVSDDRPAGRLRFYDRDAEILVLGVHESLAIRVKPGPFLVVHASQKFNISRGTRDLFEPEHIRPATVYF